MKKNYPINTQKNGDSAQTADYRSELERLMPYDPDTTRFTVLCSRQDYSAGRIARAVEDCNAHVLNLNVTTDCAGENMIAVDLRVDRVNIESIARSLARYDYTVVGREQEDDDVHEMYRERAAEVLRYLEL